MADYIQNTKKKKIADPNQLNQGGNGALNNAASANPSGVEQFTPNNTPYGVFTQMNQRNTSALNTLSEKAGFPQNSSSPQSIQNPVAPTVPSSINPQISEGARLQQERLGAGPTQQGPISPIPLSNKASAFRSDIRNYPSPTDTNVYTFNNKLGGSARVETPPGQGFTPTQQKSLQDTIEFNALQSTKERFARDAANTEAQNQRYGNPYSQENSDLRAARFSQQDALRRNDLVGLATANKNLRALEGIQSEKAKIGAEANAAQALQLASISKTQDKNALEASKQQDALRKNLYDYFQKGRSLNQTEDPLGNYAAAKQALGDNIDQRTLYAALGPNLIKGLVANKGNIEEQVKLLETFPEADKEQIINQFQ